MDSHVSSLLNNLVFIRQIGEGGGGEVFLYHRATDRKPFAVKKMKKTSAKLMKYVRRAIDSCARCYHPHLVCYHGHVYDSKHAFLIFEYMPGGDLKKEVIRKRKVVPLNVFRKWISQLVSVLVFLRKKGIMHRDIKPDNVLLTSSDLSKADVKLSDFETCRKMLAVQEERMTEGIGSYGYMAPDINASSYTSQVDIWSLGCLVFELTTFKLPFSQSNRSRDLQMREGPVFPNIPVVPQEVQHFIRYCLVYDPNQRPSAIDLSRHPLISRNTEYPVLPQEPNYGLAELVESENQPDEEEKKAEDDMEETGFGRGPLEQIQQVKESSSSAASDVQDLETNLQAIIDKQVECMALIAKLTSRMEAKMACDIAKRQLILNQNLMQMVIRTRKGMNEDTTSLERISQALLARGEELTTLGTQFSSS